MGPVIVGIVGANKSGKSSLSLTFPTPIYHFEFDVGGFDRASWRHRELIKEGLLVSECYAIPQQVVMDRLAGGIKLKRSNKQVGMKELWYGRFLETYFNVLSEDRKAPNGGPFKTIVMDSFPEVWSLCTKAYLQELQELAPEKNRTQLLQIEYAEPNGRMTALVQGPKQVGKNLVLTHYMVPKYEKVRSKDEWIDMEVGQTRAGWRQCEKEADIMLQTIITKEKEGMVPYAEVTLCGLALEVTGMKFREPSWGQIVTALSMYRGEM